LNHAAVEQQAFDLVSLPGAARIRRPAVDMKCVTDDGDFGLSRRRVGGPGEKRMDCQWHDQ
jgi:hypothetical protein